MDLVIGYQTSPTRYLFRSGASEATEFFTKRVVTNEERSFYKFSGAVLDDIEMARAVIHRLRPSSLLAHDVSPLPSVVEAFIAPPPLRLSLHPRAMLATCAVHAGEMPARWEECCRHPALPFCH